MKKELYNYLIKMSEGYSRASLETQTNPILASKLEGLSHGILLAIQVIERGEESQSGNDLDNE